MFSSQQNEDAAVEFFPRFEWLRTRRLGFRFESKADISERCFDDA